MERVALIFQWFIHQINFLIIGVLPGLCEHQNQHLQNSFHRCKMNGVVLSVVLTMIPVLLAVCPGHKEGQEKSGEVLLLPESSGAVGDAIRGVRCMQESRWETQRCKISGVLSMVPQLSCTVLEVMAHCAREFTVPLCCGGWPSRGTNGYVSTETGIFIVPAEVAKHALPSTDGLTTSEHFSVVEWGDFIPARTYGFQYKLQTRRSKNSSGNCCIDLVLGFSKMSAWADCLRLSEVLGISVSNLIMHPRKS